MAKSSYTSALPETVEAQDFPEMVFLNGTAAGSHMEGRQRPPFILGKSGSFARTAMERRSELIVAAVPIERGDK